MQVSVESTQGLERRLEVQVPAQEITQAVDKRLISLCKTVRLKGFRPGKAPVKVVRQQFGQQVRQEVLSELVKSTLAEAVTQEKLNPAGQARIERLSETGDDLRYRATFEVLPEITLKGIETLEVIRDVAEVGPADVDAMIENLRRQRPRFVPVDRESRDSDRVKVDFEGTIDGATFEGGTGQDVLILLDASRMLPDFEAGLKGLKAGEERDIPVNFPAEYGVKHLAGKQARFHVRMKSVEEQELPELDEEFLRSFGVEEGGIAQLRKEVEENMRRELAQAVRARMKQQVMDGLLASNPLQVPNVLVENQVQEMQLEAGRRMGARDVSQLPQAEPFQDSARRRVSLGLLIDELIRSKNIELDRAKVHAKLQERAAQAPDPEQLVKLYREHPEALRQLEALVLEEQAIDWLLEHVHVTERASTFKELMNFGAHEHHHQEKG